LSIYASNWFFRDPANAEQLAVFRMLVRLYYIALTKFATHSFFLPVAASRKDCLRCYDAA
jgi:hypothetical protein